jgi:hypothetical protein
VAGGICFFARCLIGGCLLAFGIHLPSASARVRTSVRVCSASSASHPLGCLTINGDGY